MERAIEEFSQVIACDYCLRHGYPKLLRDESFNLPWPGYIGSNYENTGVLLVGQNPGISPARFHTQDREFAEAIIAVGHNADAISMASLKDIHDRIIPTWPISGRHFPLAECGLQLNDIAYTNVVRCRTQENAPPSGKITQSCIANHFVRWLDWLQPRVVICIGKWAHDNIEDLLEARGIPHGFVNRRRSLSSIERSENLESVVALVHSIVSGEHSKVTRQSRGPTPAQATSVQPVDTGRESAQLPSNGLTTDGYHVLFQELGLHNIEIGKTLKHWKPLPSLYFNRRRDGYVYFTGYLQDLLRFRGQLWDRISPQKSKDDKPNLITIVPKAGRERDAFMELLN